MIVVGTSHGDVSIESVTEIEGGVEVRLTEAVGGDPNFVIINPPTLVPDPAGDRVVNGIPYRRDPIAAIAEVIARNGGTMAKARDSRRGRR